MLKLPSLTYEHFESNYKFILKKSNDALIFESKGYKTEAYSLYRSIITNIDNIIVFGSCKESENEVLKKINNLKSIRNNICMCIERIQQENVSNGEILIAEIIYSIQSECQYTKIFKNGMSDVPCYPGSLEIYKFHSSKKAERGFIIVSDWMGALIKNVTPILITPEGALIFFDTEKDEDIKVAVTLPYNVTTEEFQRCVSILSSLAFVVVDGVHLHSDLPLQPEDNSGKSTGEVIATGLSKVSQSVSKGFTVGATKLGELVCKGSNELCQHINPGQATLNPNIKNGLEYARTGSHALIEVSGKAIGVLSRATQYLASKAAPHIITTANNIIPGEWKEKGKNGEISTAEQIALVTGSGVQGLLLLFDSLHDAAVTFGRSAARSSGQIMGHRYGEEIGQSTENALYAAGNLGMMAIVAGQFTKKGILKSAAAITAIEVSDKYHNENNGRAKNCLEYQKSISNNVKHI